MFFVGGPNVRKDYHLEEGEELFYMRKGDMCLKIQEGGRFVDVPIKEGEVGLARATLNDIMGALSKFFTGVPAAGQDPPFPPAPGGHGRTRRGEREGAPGERRAPVSWS